MPEIKVDTTCANKTIIFFESRLSLNANSTVQVFIHVGITNLYVVDTPTPFLFCFKNMNTLGIYLNNINNRLIYQNGKSTSIFCRWGHLWIFVNKNFKIAMGIFLIEAKLCQVYTRFRHSSINKLYNFLSQADYDIQHKTMKIINKFCHYYQIKGESPQ